jgi:alpha-methylacyl-CoA racemase
MLDRTFRTRGRDEWAELLAPLDACVAPVLTLQEAPAHPHARARGSFTEVGAATVGAPAPRFASTPATAREVTQPGAATDDLLAEAGYSAAQVAELSAAGILG